MKKPLVIIFMTLLTLPLCSQEGQQWLGKRVSISVQEKSLEEVLKGLERDLRGMVFAYSPGSFDMHKRVTVKLDSVPLRQVLEQVFNGQPLECTEMRGKIFLKKKVNDGTRSRKTGTGSGATAVSEPAAQAVRINRVVDTTKSSMTIKETRVDRPSDTRTDPEPVSPAGPETNNQQRGASAEGVRTDNSVTIDLTVERKVSKAPELKPVNPFKTEPETIVQVPGNPDLPPVQFKVTDSVATKESFWSKLKLPGFLSKSTEEQPKPENKSNEVVESKKLRLYAASTTALTGINGDGAIKMGGRAVWLKNPRFGIGLAGYAVQGPSTLDNTLGTDHRLAGGYGGFHMEYNFNPNNFLHLSFPLLIAGGGMTYVDQQLNNLDPNRVNVDAQAVFVLEPGVTLEMNVIKYLKVGLDLSYRYTSDTELNYESGAQILDSNGLNGLSAGITIKLGIF